MRREDCGAADSAGERAPSGDFGVRLKRLRLDKGWLSRELADRAAVSPGQISNLENGRRHPTEATAKALDRALGAGGELIALAGRARPVIDSGPDTPAPVDVGSLVPAYSAILDTLRGLGRSSGPGPVLGTLRASARTLSEAGRDLRGKDADAVWMLAAQYAEYLGWMSQEAGDNAAAQQWTDQAVTWGARAGDETVAAYALVRRALIAQHRGDPHATVEFARRAAEHPAATTRVRAHAARREAQGHALIGDHDACRRSLERSAQLMGARGEPDAPSWGPRADAETSRLIEASCLVALRRFDAAVDLFHSELGADSAAENSHTRFRIRRAVAYAGSGYVGEACELLQGIAPVVRRLDSATIRAELAAFFTEAKRHRVSPREHAFLADLAAEL